MDVQPPVKGRQAGARAARWVAPPAPGQDVAAAADGVALRNLAAERALLAEPDAQALEGMARARVGALRAAAPVEFDLGGLRELRCRLPLQFAQATARNDGRLVPVVLVTIADTATGATRAGIAVELHDRTLPDGRQLLDRAYTDQNGMALLRFPAEQGRIDPVTGRSVPGAVNVAGTVVVPTLVDALVPSPVAGAAAGTIPVRVDSLAPTEIAYPVAKLPSAAHVRLEDSVGRLLTDAATGAELPGRPQGDDLLRRLPIEFGVDLCRRIADLSSRIPDPVLGRVAPAGDFRAHRTPVVRRITVPRIGSHGEFWPRPEPLGEVPSTAIGPVRAVPGCAVDRYLVRLRQEWVFLGYTLGELRAIDPLDPGQTLDRVLDSVRRTLDTAQRVIDNTVSQATSSLTDLLHQASSLDVVVNLAATLKAELDTSGLFGMLGAGLFGGSLGGATVTAGGRLETATNTSLDVTHLLNSAASLFNNAVHLANATVRDQLDTIKSAAGEINPLLSRAANMMRWSIYETYAVCNEVEDVVAITPVPVFEKFGAVVPLTPDQIVDLAPILKPRLLRPELASEFAVLERQIDEEVAGGPAFSAAYIEVAYTAVNGPATLTVSLAGNDTTLELTPGGTRAHTTLPLPYPMRDNQLQRLTLTLSLGVPTIVTQNPGFPIQWLGALFPAQILPSVTITSINLWAGRAPAENPSQRWQSGAVAALNALSGTGQSASVDLALNLQPDQPNLFQNPLVRHITRNRTHYFGVLLDAALRQPSLRADIPQIRYTFGPDDPLWELPILGVEGDRLLVVQELQRVGVDNDRGWAFADPFAEFLFNDEGCATIVQLLAPGAYTEALQGLLTLDDAVGKLHPALLPVPAGAAAPAAPGGPLPAVPAANGTGLPPVPVGV